MNSGDRSSREEGGGPQPRPAADWRLFAFTTLTYGGDEAVAPLGQGLNETRIVRRVAERLADLLHRRAQAVVEVDKGVTGPEPTAQLLARPRALDIDINAPPDDPATPTEDNDSRRIALVSLSSAKARRSETSVHHATPLDILTTVLPKPLPVRPLSVT